MLTVFAIIYVLAIVFGGIYLTRHLDQDAPAPGYVIQRVPALVPAR